MTSDLTAPAPEALAWGRTARLALREFGPQDHATLVEMHRDERLRAHLIDDYPMHDPDFVRLFLNGLARIYRKHEGLGIWHATRLGEGGGFAGWFSLMPILERPGEVEIGSRLLPIAWGRGLALEGGEIMLEHAFTELGLPRVWGICHPDNRSAQAVLAALGFEDHGLARYDGQDAFHHVIDLNAWRETRNTSRRSRLRRAIAVRKADASRNEAAASPS